METMKRAISFFLSLVLVLGMVPGTALTAAAEEVETQPEIAAEETTEAPAETEAEMIAEAPAETETEVIEEVPAETEAETAAEETVPEETAAQETAPEEAEITEKVIDVQEAANAAVAPTGITLKASATRTYVGDRVKLTATVKPSDANQEAIKWELDAPEAMGASFNDETGTLTATAPGKATVRVVSTKDAEIKEEIEITFVQVCVAFNLLPIDEDYLVDTDGDSEMDAVQLTSGQSLEVSLKYLTNETGNVEDWETEYLIEPNVTWKRSSESEDYASLTVDDEDENVVILKAKTVTEKKTFTLTAEDAVAGTAKLKVNICPKPAGLTITDANGKNVGGKTITIDLEANDREKYTFLLYANIVPEGAAEKITWKTSSDMIAGVEVEEDSNGAWVTVSVGGERLEGEATLTAICKDDTSIRQTVTIKTVDYLQQDELCWHSDTTKIKELVAGKSVTLKALNKTDPENKTRLTSEEVTWSIRSEDKAYATITQDGKLTARDVAMGKKIMVYCRVIGNEEKAFLTKEVDIHPKAQSVRIAGSSKTKYVNTANMKVDDHFSIDHSVAPANDGDELGALQTVTWKSSNTTIAKVGKDTGNIYWQGKNGTVTITATATDGSGKSDSINIKFGKFAEEIKIACPVKYLRSGESVTMSKDVKPSGAKVTWSLADGDEKYASITSSGKLTAKTVYDVYEVEVIARGEDGNIAASKEVEIRPKKDKILTLYAGGECVTKTTQYLDQDTESIQLTAYIAGKDDPEDVTWSYPSSVKKVSSEKGSAVFKMKKTGTATIKATSKSSGKTATVTIKGIRKAAEVRIVESGGMELSAGQSMTLKAKLYDDAGKTPTRTTVRWSVSGSSYVSINEDGKLKVRSSFKGDAKEVTVTARATDGSGVKDTCKVTIRPKATGVVIQRSGVSCVSLTHKIQDEDDLKFRLTALVYPLGEADGAVKWTSSNKKIATVSSNGGITCVGTGTVTIKAAAQDGSGEYATLKLTITKPVSTISFKGNRSMVAGGKTLTLEPVVKAADGKKPTNSAISWSISGDTSFVESFSGGVLKTKKVTERKYVTVTAKAKDGSGVRESWDVTICPATTAVYILDDFDNKVGDKTLYMRVGEELDLGAVSYPSREEVDKSAQQSWTWSSSSKTYATVSSSGIVTAKKAGTVTIKAVAKDGTGKSDTVSIKILKK